MPSRIRLKRVESDGDWAAYHHIRKRVLWEGRGLDGYDERHPDDRLAGNHPLLLMRDDAPVGTARLDVAGPRLGIVRLVAIEPDLQRRGLGRILMQEIEAYAHRLGLEQLEVNAAKEAEGFYQILGWTVTQSDRKTPLMTKALNPGDFPS
ncbi:GNAT family N-acetyltransferase [Mesorhizobium sp. M7A.F.Ca.US.008.03.1.1]|uniref:GNAT family N-acetyltransferase n=1 Tax=Mesorhizobium sp. M7A.F.Ca.US.008.03.1.1 TaxID=2496742 RepID=UPI000FCA812F|nr:GNAT family N-acetyltransferase [Mesorhizobium sp. M7A.F.Ca.US.008.03.1.1]RUW59129.1 GNAT family N-acetyltransferase [Mesorhizobium sp. M7A.F.Ca.US.008.03.1.1]